MGFRPVNLYDSDIFDGSSLGVCGNDDMFGGDDFNDLSLPSMRTTTNEEEAGKFPSPQAVIDEVMQTGMQKSRHFTQLPMRHQLPQQQKSRTPSKVSKLSSKQQFQTHRRVSSFDVADHQSSQQQQQQQQQHQIPTGRLQFQRNPYGAMPSNHRRTNSNSLVPANTSTRHKRSLSHQQSIGSATTTTSAVGGGTRRGRTRSNGQHSEDVFLHGVAAQTRF